MTLQDKLNIYDTLTTNFNPGDRIILSVLGNFLRAHDISHKDFGYLKLMPFFETMPELFTLDCEVPRPGLPPVWYATLLRRPAVDTLDIQPDSANAEEKKVLSPQEKQRIYNIISQNFTPGERYPLSDLGGFLSTQNISYKDYRYPKLRPFFEAMPEYYQVDSIQPHPGVTLTNYVTLIGNVQPCPMEEDTTAVVEEPQPEPPVQTEAGTEFAAEAESPVETAPETAEPQETPAVTTLAQLPENMELDNIFFPYSLQGVLCEYLTGARADRLSNEMLSQVKADYLAAKENGSIYHNESRDAYNFPLSAVSSNGIPIVLAITRSTRTSGSPWVVSFVGLDMDGSLMGGLATHTGASHRSVKPGDALLNFAYLGNMTTFLRALADHAQDELWSFNGAEDDFFILYQYIRVTFYRLQQQDKVCIAEDGSFAAFNTGLQSRRLGEDIFAYFIPNDPGMDMPWKFCCFCSTDSRDILERRSYKNMYNFFKEPEPATYFSKISDLLFDPACEVRLSTDHIFKDNCDRLPMDFLQRECSWNPDAAALLSDIEAAANSEQRKALFKELGTLISDDMDLFSAMNERLEGALARTIKRIRRNYKLAVPCFFPTRNVMSMMLPLSFTATGAPSLVLICERTLSGDYLGQTILTLPMAYVDARLLCRPGSEWLNTDRIMACSAVDVLEAGF